MRDYYLELPPFAGILSPGETPRQRLAYCLILFSPENQPREMLQEYISVLPWHLGGLQAMGAFEHLDVYVVTDGMLFDEVSRVLAPTEWPSSRLLQFTSHEVYWWMRRLVAMRHPALHQYAGVLHCDVGVLPRRHREYDFAKTAAWCPSRQPYAFVESPLFPPGTYRESDMFWSSVDKPANWKRFRKYVGDPHLRLNWRKNAEVYPHCLLYTSPSPRD